MHLFCLLPLTLLAGAATPEAPMDDTSRLARSSNAFGFDLYRRLLANPGNLVVSPASVSTALSMAWGGAKGETAAQMKQVLHFDGSPAAVMQASGKITTALLSRPSPASAARSA